MYSHRRSDASVRDAAPIYGGAGTDRFPADQVLEDLTATETAPTVRVQRILARYAALRAWILGAERAPATLIGHARDAARIHLAAAGGGAGHDGGWEEGRLLLRLLQASTAEAGPLMAAAAGEAARAGDRAGAAALRHAARQATLLRLAEALRRHRPGR